ncbi:hypothetical protein [Arthrobacter sp. H35-D1]|uniref:hypothetical protein n=1 Tax=Arthrobacter sp. H35-D1 TaxID=3046202 RepID=UPI0024B964B4|nr:hypothetical protein [Arthrobacter sp. H35-D1]MDJ0313850.1 hypothetical protein [Arthrobacter sp. H35-D1]
MPGTSLLPSPGPNLQSWEVLAPRWWIRGDWWRGRDWRGGDDAAAAINRLDGNGFESLWYLWVADGANAVQVKYPIAQLSRCGTVVDSVVAGKGGVTVTQRLRVSGEDDKVPYSGAGSGLQARTITVKAVDGEL